MSDSKDIEIARLRADLAAIRGAIDTLAVKGRGAHWRDHFTVFDPDGGQRAVPWEWTEPPFQLVKTQMDAMGDFGTRACQAYADIDPLRDLAQKLHWLERWDEVHIQRRTLGEKSVTLQWKPFWSPRGYYEQRRAQGANLVRAIEAAEDRETEICKKFQKKS